MTTVSLRSLFFHSKDFGYDMSVFAGVGIVSVPITALNKYQKMAKELTSAYIALLKIAVLCTSKL